MRTVNLTIGLMTLFNPPTPIIKLPMRAFLFFILSACTAPLFAQALTENENIMQPINRLFTGMSLGDSAIVRSAFAKEATMATVLKSPKDGSVTVRRESSIAGFLKAVGTPHEQPWNEPIWDTRIEVEGDFASVWTSYAFYLGNTFSHCGIDAFQLVKQNGEWKIFHLTDTRHKEGCQVPPAISDRFR
jgi:hypothetical protein